MGKGCGLSSGRAVRRAAFTALEALESRRLMSGSPGQLDPTFGAGAGYVTSSTFGPSQDSASSAIKDSSGGYVVVGGSSNGATIVRYNADGSHDAGFGNGGVVFVDPVKMANAWSVVQDGSGYIIGGQADSHEGSFVR